MKDKKCISCLRQTISFTKPQAINNGKWLDVKDVGIRRRRLLGKQKFICTNLCVEIILENQRILKKNFHQLLDTEISIY